ncbi:MAG: M15 family metallopeptidase, partial [Chitinophagaceae bacterium]|nr:M15 family metallopeptidase [Chitinophagaceae bacterium]
IYDNKTRPIQVKSLNQTGGLDVITTQYSWSGQPLVVVNYQSKGGTNAQTTTTITTNDYDALGRLVKTSKKIANSLINSNALSTEKMIAVNKYDALGQLTTKTLGAADANGAAGTEKQAFEYNIRGWLLGMNRGYAQNSNNTSNFGFELNYDQYPGYGGTTGNRFYTGNIGGMTWRGKQNGAQIRRYNFSYDNANRILNADYLEASGSSFAKTTTDFSSQMGDGTSANSAYDYNGNILAMTQKGLVSGATQVIDQLSYTYKSGSNKLAKVSEAAMNTAAYQLGDFNDGANTDDDYDYDANGNLTRDQNKNITSISYNVLNLPEYIVVAGKGAISYQYDAAGNKLNKKVTEGSATKQTDYLGGSIFENNVLQHVAMEEGRLRPSGSSFVADYMLKDHLGNVRSLVQEDGTLLEETSYYPFGLTMKGISYQNTAVAENKKKFVGQLLDDDLGLNWYQFRYRNHDPQIGRFTEIDPLAAQYAHNGTYVYAENKPINGIDLEGLEWLPVNKNGQGISPDDKENINGYKWVGYDVNAETGEKTAKAGTVATAYTFGEKGRTTLGADKSGNATEKWESYSSLSTGDAATDKKIATLHTSVQNKMKEFILKADNRFGIKLRVTDGFRSVEQQDKLYAQGRTAPGNRVTNARGGYSNHNFGLAVDVVPMVNGKPNFESNQYPLIGRIGQSVGLEWGGSWKTILDQPHFQDLQGFSLKDLRAIPKDEKGLPVLPQ